jgi:steroid delta-isomerase-like uncharacterized protein
MSNFKSLGEDLLDALNRHDVERLSNLFDSNFSGIDIGERDPLQGIVAVRRYYERYFKAFPDFSMEGEQIAENDRIALIWTARGTHLGSLMHIPPTGRKVEIRGTTYLTTCNQKIIKSVNIWDMAGMLRNIGLLPDL